MSTAVDEQGPKGIRGKTILVVDPDARMRQQCLDGLQRVGLSAVGARDLAEIQRLLDQADLVVTDWGVGPGLNEGLFYFRQLQPWLRPVILYSDLPDSTDRRGAGLKHHVAKPKFGDLLKAIVIELVEPVLQAQEPSGWRGPGL